VLVKGVPYPVKVKRAKYKNQPSMQGICYVHWIGYPSGMLVDYSELLPDTAERQKEYLDAKNHGLMVRTAEKEKKREQGGRKKRRRGVGKGKTARKRQKEREQELKKEDRDE
jgi:hypothetical protein